jgi:hypothetical protein
MVPGGHDIAPVGQLTNGIMNRFGRGGSWCCWPRRSNRRSSRDEVEAWTARADGHVQRLNPLNETPALPDIPVTPTAHITHTARTCRSDALCGRLKDGDALNMVGHRKHVPRPETGKDAGQIAYRALLPGAERQMSVTARTRMRLHERYPHYMTTTPGFGVVQPRPF